MSHHLVSPRVLLAETEVSEGDTVLELGNPVGFFAQAALDRVGVPGRVIVAGANEDALERVSHLHQHRQFETALLADVLVGRAFDHHSADWVILTNVLSSSLHSGQFCLSITQYLKPHGHVLVLDWRTEAQAGPEAERRVSHEAAIKLLSSCGLKLTKTLTTPGYHYGLVFERSEAIR